MYFIVVSTKDRNTICINFPSLSGADRMLYYHGDEPCSIKRGLNALLSLIVVVCIMMRYIKHLDST